jgi:hypothetical protein
MPYPPSLTQLSKIKGKFNLFEQPLINLHAVSYISLFVLFLTPFSLLVRTDYVSANYLFIFLPLIFLIFGQNLIRPANEIILIALIFIIIFFVTLAYQNEYYIFWERRLISFLLFMSLFSLTIIKIDAQKFRYFKYAIVITSVIYSLNSFYVYFNSGGQSLGYDVMRPIVQSQRYGFILLLALWLVFFYKPALARGILLKYLIIFILINGLGLTFSRSSVAGLICSSIAFFCIALFRWADNPTSLLKVNIYKLVMHILAGFGLVYASYFCFPDYFEYFSWRLLNINITAPAAMNFAPFPLPPNYDTYVYNELESSEGYRLYMIKEVFSYLLDHPLFGSGFLGVWVMFKDLNGAAHNQLLDTLFRTGAIGFFLYLYLLVRVFIYLYKARETALFCGLIGVLAIGMFHETFKLSQGSFVLAFILAVCVQRPKVPVSGKNIQEISIV